MSAGMDKTLNAAARARAGVMSPGDDAEDALRATFAYADQLAMARNMPPDAKRAITADYRRSTETMAQAEPRETKLDQLLAGVFGDPRAEPEEPSGAAPESSAPDAQALAKEILAEIRNMKGDTS